MLADEVELSRPTYTLFTKSHNLSEEGLSLPGRSQSVVIPPESKMAIVNCAAYAAGRRIADVGISEINETLRQQDRFIWLGLHEPERELLAQVQAEFGLHDLAIEDAHKAHQRPKLEVYGDSLFVVLRTVQVNPQTRRIGFGETHFFVGDRYLVSVRHGSSIP